MFLMPLTAIGCVEQITNDYAKSVVITAAFSSLGKMFINLCHQQGIRIIAVVRKDDQVLELQETYKVKYAFNSEDKDFYDNFSEAVIFES